MGPVNVNFACAIPYLLFAMTFFICSHSTSIGGFSGTDLNGRCTANYKVYVYNISNSKLLDLGMEARRNMTYHVCKKCIYEQFALEYVVYDYFMQSCARTFNPEEADFFYLPIIREIDYRIALQTGQRAPSLVEEALIDAIENGNTSKWKTTFKVTDEFWRLHNGADHIIAMAAPVTNFRHQSNMRGFFHYMIQLYPPIFLNVELSHSFIKEYPICSTLKNIVMPYPSTDPDLFSGRLFTHPPREKLIFYQGGNHGSCSFIRTALQTMVQSKKYAIQRGPQKREFGFESSVFCPIPVGDSPSSKRMYDVMNFGCIPVIISDDLVWAYSNETGGFLNTATFAIHLPQSIVQLSAKKLVSDYISKDGDINKGNMLPSGTSVYRLLMDVAAEEEAMSKQLKLLQNDSGNSSNRGEWQQPRRRLSEVAASFALRSHRSPSRFNAAVPNSNMESRSLLHLLLQEQEQQRLMMEIDSGDSSNDGRISPHEIELRRALSSCAITADAAAVSSSSSPTSTVGANEAEAGGDEETGAYQRGRLLAKTQAALKPKAVASLETDSAWTVAGGGINTLVRLLEKISSIDIALLQEGVKNASYWYRFYAFDDTLGKAAPALTAGELGMGTYPGGGAIEALEYMLNKRKRSGGIEVVAALCEAERTRKHQYIGRYPCEKHITA